MEETLSLIETDSCLDFSFYDKTLFLEDLRQFKNASGKQSNEPLIEATKKIGFLVEACLVQNEVVYLKKLMGAMHDVLFDETSYDESEFTPMLRNFDNLLSSFACELLFSGFSKKYLYKFFNSLKKNRKELTFEQAYDQMVVKFSDLSKRTFVVVVKLSFKSVNSAIAACNSSDDLLDSIPAYLENYVGNHKSFLKHNRMVCFYVKQMEALDAYMAARETYEQLAKLLDFKQNLISGFSLPSYALAFEKNEESDKYIVSAEKFFELDNGGQILKSGDTELFEKLRVIYESKLVSQDVKDRVTAALRHLRIGDGQVELEQQFINYWIALEFIFASSSRNDNTYTRIKENLINILTACYVKRNMLYLKEWMFREHLIGKDDDFVDKINDDELVGRIPDILLRYRIKNMKSHIHKQDKLKKYMNNHKTHLVQHISRIYRLRNELVHEAALKQDIVNVTSNLRFYLVFVLNQMVEYFASDTLGNKPKTMLQFFWQYETILKSITSSSSIEYAIEVIKNMRMAKSYIV